MSSRRNFLKHGTLGALAAGFSVGLGDKVLGNTRAGSSTRPLTLTRGDFSAQLQTTFTINDGSRKIPLKLVEVADLGSKRTITGHREAFSLVLTGASSATLKQETYSIEHEKLGEFSMLLVPIFARDKSVRYYEINVNRLHG